MGEEQRGDFDVNAWLEQGKSALVALADREREIESEIRELEKERSEIQEQRGRIEAVFGKADDSGERRTGVIDLCREVVASLEPEKRDGHDIGWTEDDLVTAVLRKDPLMKETSVRSSLRSLAKKGEVERLGKRGSRRYRRPAAPPSEVAEKPDLTEQILAKLLTAGSKGLAPKDIAWIVGDDETAMLLLDQMMHEEQIETFPAGEGVFRYRMKDAGRNDGEVHDEMEQSGLFGGTADETALDVDEQAGGTEVGP